MYKKFLPIFFFLAISILSGCGSFGDKSFYSEDVFKDVSKEELFNTASKILKKHYTEYPIVKEDLKEGVIETDWIELLSPSAYLGKRNKIEIRIEEIFAEQKTEPQKSPSPQQTVKAVRLKIKAFEETNKTFSEPLESERADWKNTISNEAMQEVIMFRIRHKLVKTSPGQEYLEREKMLEQLLEKM